MVIRYKQHTHTDIPKVYHLIGYNEFHHGNQRVYWLFVKEDTFTASAKRLILLHAHTHSSAVFH